VTSASRAGAGLARAGAWRLGWLVVLAAGFGWLPGAGGAGVSRAKGMKPDPSDELFTKPTVRTFKIEVLGPALSALNKDNRSYVRGTVAEGGRIFKDIGLHLKGMGSFRPLHEKPSFVVKFDKYSPGQDYFGLTKIMLNNASQDPTYLAELLGTEMFREAGVPAARVTHAFVEFNGRPLGLYVLVEAMNKEFLRRHFENAKGNLYEAYLQDIDQRLDQDGGSDTSQADLRRLLEATQIEEPTRRWERLNRVLDVNGYLSHLAVELFTAHTDGYALNRNNYRLYHDPTSDKFVFIAHGIDWAFANTGLPGRPPQNSLVTRAVLQTPEGKRLFKERFAQLFTKLFRVDVLTNQAHAAAAKLKAAARNPAEAKEVENGEIEMCRRIVARHQTIAQELARPEPTPLEFDANGVARLLAWRAKTDQGAAVTDRAVVDGHATLHIRANQTSTIASWRTNVFLPQGKFRFQGLARTFQVVGLTNQVVRGNGAGLRISGDKRTNELRGDSEWRQLQHDFEVTDFGGDAKELVCELRANQGEAWFDLNSLQLLRRK
jgi:hypothetical protein